MIWLCFHAIQANPILLRYFSEFYFDSQDKWFLELRSEWEEFDLDELYLRCGSDSADFKVGLHMDTSFLVITQDSLTSTFEINREGDTLELCWRDESYPLDYLAIPDLPAEQSLSLTADYHYLDNSPTMGFPNDTADAQCRIYGTVTDTSGRPLDSETLEAYWGYNTYFPMCPLAIDTLGRFSVTALATDVHFIFYRDHYHVLQQMVQALPETTYSILCQMVPEASSVRQPFQPNSEGFQLGENYPNPFNSSTFFEYVLPEAGRVSVRIFDVRGRLVETLFDGFQGKGCYRLRWNAFAEPSGMYFYQVLAQNRILRKKCLLIR